MNNATRSTLLSHWWRDQDWSTAVILPEASLAAPGAGGLPLPRPQPAFGSAGRLSSWGKTLAPWIASETAGAPARGALARLARAATAEPGEGSWLASLGQRFSAWPEASSGITGLADALERGSQSGGVPQCSCAICQGMAAGPRRDLIDRFGGLPAMPPPVPDAAAALAAAYRVPKPAVPEPAGATAPAGAPGAASAPVATGLAIADADLFRLETNPGASKTIYLNFLGANLSGTAWIPSGSTWNGVAPAFSLDSDTSTNFSAAEKTAIKEIFARVACDYAPFDVNVTTKAPTIDRINRASSSDNVYGTVCLISNISSQAGFPNSGGVAYVGVFDSVNSERYKPALVFPDKLGNSAKNIAEASSHEVGHNLNLRHDGTSSSAYYTGQGNSPGWAPIMGVGYYKTLTQFSRGTYSGANNTENDFSLIAAEGVSYWQDAVGNDLATAAALTLTDANGDGVSDKLQLGGTIELTVGTGLGQGLGQGTPDRDVYSFLAPSNGSVTINVRNALYFFDPAAASFVFAPVPSGYGNVRLDARLQDAAGTVLADWNTNSSLDVSNFTASNLIGGQNYYLSVFANAASPDLEDTYGSVGDYVFDLVYQGQGYSLSGPATVSEGQAFSLGITTPQLADGTILDWRVSGTGISADDFNPAGLAGSVQVTAGGASLVLGAAADNAIEATETALFELLSGGSVVASRSISLLDTNRLWGTAASETITGTANRFERITGVQASGTTSAALGRNQLDTVTGGVGSDEFLLSEIRAGAVRVFYNDNNSATTGTGDCLRILDFNASEDKLRFAGGRYFSVGNGLDTQIWFDSNNNGSLNTSTTATLTTTDELIAVLSGVNLGLVGAITTTTAPAWVVFG